MNNQRQSDYTVAFGWNWWSLFAAIRAAGVFIRPMPGWLRVTAARDLLRRTALRADERGITGSTSLGSCPWNSVTHIVIWRHRGLRIVAVVRHGDGDQAGGQWGIKVPRSPGSRGRTGGTKSWRSRYPPRAPYLNGGDQYTPVPGHLQVMAPDGMPFGAENLLTTNGRGVRADQLKAVTRRFAPQARVIDLSRHAWAPYSPGEGPLHALAEFLEAIHLPWRRLLWTGGVAFSVWGITDDSRKLGSGLLPSSAVGGHVFGLVLCGLLLLVLLIRWGFVLRARRRAWLPGDPDALISLAEDPPGTGQERPAIDRDR